MAHCPLLHILGCHAANMRCAAPSPVHLQQRGLGNAGCSCCRRQQRQRSRGARRQQRRWARRQQRRGRARQLQQLHALHLQRVGVGQIEGQMWRRPGGSGAGTRGPPRRVPT